MQVLSVASEVFPLVKTGGLADVAGALPAALAPHGVAMKVLLPGYPAVMSALGQASEVARIADLFGGPARLVAGEAAGLDLIAIDAPHLFERAGNIYLNAAGVDWPDNWRRFAALAMVAADLAGGLVKGYAPDLIHAHDWQAGLVPAYLRYRGLTHVPSVMTVHNLAFQGQFGADVFDELGLPPHAFAMDGVEYYGGVGFLKAGLALADAITTVSPTYAREIRSAAGGMGLEGLLDQRASVLSGIVNGIDTKVWDPSSDPALEQTFTHSSADKRKPNKRALEARFGLEQDDGPLLAAVTRLTWQKGVDLIAGAADAIVAMGARLAVLGSGDPALQAGLQAAANRHPGRIGMVVGYDESLAHLMQGGADAVLVPSRFEPCGLTQLCGLRYGAVPIVARVGGLNDTVIDANEMALEAGVATGFQFAPVDAPNFLDAVNRAVAVYQSGKPWARMQRKGMKTDVSWDRSAARYADLYRSLAGEAD